MTLVFTAIKQKHSRSLSLASVIWSHIEMFCILKRFISIVHSGRDEWIKTQNNSRRRRQHQQMSGKNDRVCVCDGADIETH